MSRRRMGYACWLLLAGLLYFFENNTGTRIVLACTLLLPLVPAIRRGLTGADRCAEQPRPLTLTEKAFSDREEEDPGAVRAYQPGDPVSRIHWKLTAKQDELLVREPAKSSREEHEQRRTVPAEERRPARPLRKRLICLALLLSVLMPVLLAAIPAARLGFLALMNRLFDASEAVNAYAYERFAVPESQPVWPAVLLLAAAGLLLLGTAILSGRRLPALGIMAGCAAFQVYFGLAFPGWVNAALFVLFGLWSLRRPWEKRTALAALAGAAAVSLAVLLVWPGVDAATEAASETARDWLNRAALTAAGVTRELPAGENETRHVHTQSLTEGDGEAQPGRAYRLVKVEEEQVSMPHWTDYLRIVLLLLLTVAAVVVPFLPFVLLNRQRKKALDARRLFASENAGEAIAAIFQHVTAWLEATGNGAGNKPYAEWTETLAARISPEYAERFAECERLFEEAAYSTHGMREEERQQALALLNETERILQGRAGWKQRLRLRYRECLWA